MKRTALLRKTPLDRKAQLQRGAPMKKKRPKRENAPRDADFLDFVRSQPCMALGCPNPSEAHHFGRSGMGLKSSDYEAVPLCHFHHVECWHGKAGLPGGTRVEWKARFILRAEELVAAFKAL